MCNVGGGSNKKKIIWGREGLKKSLPPSNILLNGIADTIFMINRYGSGSRSMSGIEIKEEPSDEVQVNEDSTMDTSQGRIIGTSGEHHAKRSLMS